MARADRSHDCQAAHGVQTRADHAAVDAVVAEVPDQFWLHLNAGAYLRRPQVMNFEAQYPVERNHFFEYFLQPLDKLFFENNVLERRCRTLARGSRNQRRRPGLGCRGERL